MSLLTLGANNSYQNPALAKAVKQLQSRTTVRATGANANTKINVPGIRIGDTIDFCEYHPTAAGDPVVIADAVIQGTAATGTVTFATAVDGNTFAVGGVTFRMKTVPIATDGTDILLSGTDAQNATRAAAAVNAYFNKHNGANYNKRNKPVVASSTGSSGVLTFTATADGVGDAPVVTSSGSTVAVSGSASASATVTCATAVNGNTVTVQGIVFTIRTTPTAGVLTDVALGASDTAQALALSNAINAYQNRKGFSTALQASPAAAVVTITPIGGNTGNTVALAGTVTTLAASGSTLTGGTATGGIKTATDTHLGTVLVIFFNTH